jgi:mxaJ protein
MNALTPCRYRATLLALLFAGCGAAPAGPVLRVCADPNNLPFSNRAGDGFENELAELVADDMGARLEYTWWPQRRGFVRNTLRAGSCDVIMGVPYSYELVLATRPYYRSTYVFVTREEGPRIESLDDPRLRELRIGVQVIGEDYLSTPPVHALTRRGIIGTLAPYRVIGDYAAEMPQAPVVEAVADGAVDVAIVWGPLAGYTAQLQDVPLRITPVQPQIDLPFLPFVYDISMGVRREDAALQARLNDVLVRRADDIDAILFRYGVPVLDLTRRLGE